MTDFVLVLGKLLIISILCFSWYMFFEEEMDLWFIKAPKLNFTFIPSAIIAIATYLITTQFLYVYSVAVKTIFICFCNIFLITYISNVVVLNTCFLNFQWKIAMSMMELLKSRTACQ